VIWGLLNRAIANDLECPLKVIALSVSQKCSNVLQVNYNGCTSYESNYFYRRMRPEGLLYNAERDLLAIAKFLVGR